MGGLDMDLHTASSRGDEDTGFLAVSKSFESSSNDPVFIRFGGIDFDCFGAIGSRSTRSRENESGEVKKSE
jgi:hypothetical protein